MSINLKFQRSLILVILVCGFGSFFSGMTFLRRGDKTPARAPSSPVKVIASCADDQVDRTEVMKLVSKRAAAVGKRAEEIRQLSEKICEDSTLDMGKIRADLAIVPDQINRIADRIQFGIYENTDD